MEVSIANKEFTVFKEIWDRLIVLVPLLQTMRCSTFMKSICQNLLKLVEIISYVGDQKLNTFNSLRNNLFNPTKQQFVDGICKGRMQRIQPLPPTNVKQQYILRKKKHLHMTCPRTTHISNPMIRDFIKAKMIPVPLYRISLKGIYLICKLIILRNLGQKCQGWRIRQQTCYSQ